MLKNVLGLHARPSALLVHTLHHFASEVTLEVDGHVVNPRSILCVLSLAAGYDSSLTFTFRGDDASQALLAVKHLFETRFQEAYVPAPVSSPLRQ
ncbi:MAG: HPr family phosphocarrier protein [Verrucomicrobia bacterium]|nr:HPr family phosphocarrier protein [Verrucomicrobiota bacterium]